MTPRDIFLVGLRLFGLWFLLSAMRYLPYACSTVSTFGSPFWLSMPWGEKAAIVSRIVLELIFNPGIGVGLLLGAARITRRFYPQPGSAGGIPESRRIGAGDLYQVAAFLVGIYLLVQTPAPAVRVTYEVMVESRLTQLSPTAIGDFVQAVVYLITGLFLVFGSRGISRFMAHLGHDPDNLPAQQFSLRLLLIIVIACGVLLGLIRYLAGLH